MDEQGDVSPNDRDSSDNKMNAAPAQANNGSGGGQFANCDASPLKKNLHEGKNEFDY